MDAAQCIGCGACVAACPNGSASLFTAAKITHLGLLPQGQPERLQRARRMVEQMDVEGFGGCTLYGECQEACPKHDQHRHHHPDEPRLPPGRRRAGPRGGGRVGLSRARGLGAGAARRSRRWCAARPRQQPSRGRVSARRASCRVRARRPGARRRRAGRGPGRAARRHLHAGALRPAPAHRHAQPRGRHDPRGRARPGQLGRRLRRPAPSPHLRRTS